MVTVAAGRCAETWANSGATKTNARKNRRTGRC
jgi:hypothetical protein